MKVVDVVKETADAHTFLLEQAEGGTPAYQPGQFLTVRIPTDWAAGAARCYSVCSAPGHDELIAVTVKRTWNGFASNWLCDHVGIGDELEVLPPAGTFTPESLDEDLLLLAGGSGITPVMSILKAVLFSGKGSVTLLYANRQEDGVIFRDQLNNLVEQFPDRLHVIHWLEAVQGIPQATALSHFLAPFSGREVYICGPGPFMDVAVRGMEKLGVAASRIHVEKFSSLEGDPFAAESVEIDSSQPSAKAEVILDGETHVIEWPMNAKLLDVLLALDIAAPFSCREGACSACACVVEEGEVALERNEVLDKADLADGLILGCQATPLSDRLRINYDG